MICIKKYLIILSGSFIFSLSLNLFLIPSKLVTGGVSGIATILFYTFRVSPSITTAFLNVIIGIFAYCKLGKEFVADSLVGVVSIPVFMWFTQGIDLFGDDIVLCSIFGGIVSGIGIGITFSQGSSTGGMDIVSRISQKRFPSLPIGRLLFVFDLVVITASFIAFKDAVLSLYGIMALFISSWVIDYLIEKLNSGTVAFVVTKKPDEVKRGIFKNVKRGVTVLKAEGGYKDENTNLLMCVMKKKELEDFRKSTLITDENAFVVVSEFREVFGNGFKYYR